MIEKLIVWGGTRDLSSHRHIHRAFLETARKMGVTAYQLEDRPEDVQYVTPGCTVIAIDIWSEHLPYVPDVDYVLHNFSSDHVVMQNAEQENILRLQVYNIDAYGKQWDQYRWFSPEGRVLFQPWGTDLLPEEFMEPVFNPMDRNATFVGAIWAEISNGQDLGNQASIQELEGVIKERGLKFKHLTQIPQTEMVQQLRNARLTPAIAGTWQVEHDYIPCRIFKNASYGCYTFSNVTAATPVLSAFATKGTIAQLVDRALQMKRKDAEEAIRSQQLMSARYNYREALIAIDRALREGK